MHGREEEECACVKQPTSIVLTLVNLSSPSAKIRYKTTVYLTNECSFTIT